MIDLIKRPKAEYFNFTIGINEDGILYVPFREVVDNIQSLPTADAIPIEWIHKRIETLRELATEYGGQAKGLAKINEANTLVWLIADWQKDQCMLRDMKCDEKDEKNERTR